MTTRPSRKRRSGFDFSEAGSAAVFFAALLLALAFIGIGLRLGWEAAGMIGRVIFGG